MNWRFAVMAVFVILVANVHAHACECSGVWPSAKEAWQEAPAVFLGTVELADPDGKGKNMMFKEQTVRIRVDEPFKGVVKGQTIELHQGGSDCDAKFRTGGRVLLYLHKDGPSGKWKVWACTRSFGDTESAGDDLLFLRGLPKSARGTRLSGDVELRDDSPPQGFRLAGGVSNLRVRITGPNGFIRNTTTNSAGTYEVYGLRPGKYSVSIEVPKNLKIEFRAITGSSPVKGDETAVILAKNGGAGVSFELVADTSVSGQMFDAKGAPMSGVCVDLTPVTGSSEDGERFFDCTQEDGRFRMTTMPPGDYWLIADDKVQVGNTLSQSTLYYPGVRFREQALKVSVKPGDHLEHLDLRLPSSELRHRISGKLEFADHVSLAHAAIRFESKEHGYSESTDTGPDGSFEFTAIAGIEGQLSGTRTVFPIMLRSCPEVTAGSSENGLFKVLEASPLSLTIDSDHENVKLELPFPSCSTLSR